MVWVVVAINMAECHLSSTRSSNYIGLLRLLLKIVRGYCTIEADITESRCRKDAHSLKSLVNYHASVLATMRGKGSLRNNFKLQGCIYSFKIYEVTSNKFNILRNKCIYEPHYGLHNWFINASVLVKW